MPMTTLRELHGKENMAACMTVQGFRRQWLTDRGQRMTVHEMARYLAIRTLIDPTLGMELSRK